MKSSRAAWTDKLADRSQPALFEAPAQPKRRRPGTCKKPTLLESAIQKMILEALQQHPLVARVERINVMAGRLLGKDGSASRFMRSCKKGRVDLDGFTTDGRVIAIEVKRPATRNYITVEQANYIRAVRAAGGCAGVATCVDEALAIVEGRA